MQTEIKTDKSTSVLFYIFIGQIVLTIAALIVYLIYSFIFS